MKKIRYGMVGGGPGAFIGGVHRRAAQLDGKFELVCGAFSSDPKKSAAMAEELGYLHGGEPSVLGLLDAISELDLEELEDLLHHCELLPSNAPVRAAEEADDE